MAEFPSPSSLLFPPSRIQERPGEQGIHTLQDHGMVSTQPEGFKEYPREILARLGDLPKILREMDLRWRKGNPRFPAGDRIKPSLSQKAQPREPGIPEGIPSLPSRCGETGEDEPKNVQTLDTTLKTIREALKSFSIGILTLGIIWDEPGSVFHLQARI